MGENVRESQVCPAVPKDLRSFPAALDSVDQRNLQGLLLRSVRNTIIVVDFDGFFSGLCGTLDAPEQKDRVIHLYSPEWSHTDSLASSWL